MKSLSSVGLGLSIVFGCLLLALVAELYYLLWWKKRFTNTRQIENDYSNPAARELYFMFCCKNPSLSSSCSLNPKATATATETNVDQSGVSGGNKDLVVLNSETEVLPRFLFTIAEETVEDLESEDGKPTTNSRSLSDLLVFNNVETPFVTPFASPSFFTPPSTPEAEFNRAIRSYSPPPRFKFLQDAEEKLLRKRMMEMVGESENRDGFSETDKDIEFLYPKSEFEKEDDEEKEGSFITVVVDKKETQDQSSTSAQVMSLVSPPLIFRSQKKNSINNNYNTCIPH